MTFCHQISSSYCTYITRWMARVKRQNQPAHKILKYQETIQQKSPVTALCGTNFVIGLNLATIRLNKVRQRTGTLDTQLGSSIIKATRFSDTRGRCSYNIALRNSFAPKRVLLVLCRPDVPPFSVALGQNSALVAELWRLSEVWIKHSYNISNHLG